jgi:hypothetical protein
MWSLHGDFIFTHKELKVSEPHERTQVTEDFVFKWEFLLEWNGSDLRKVTLDRGDVQ